MAALFFLWGFLTVWNDLLIPRFKEAFTLSYFRAMLVQLAFFGAYAIGSLTYYAISVWWGDPINRIGYKNGVILGLVIAAAGSALFMPAAAAVSYPFFLAALFTVGVGFALLQIAANPYVAILGPEATASSRLNLAQAFNSLGATLGPIAGGWLIFHVFARPGAHGADAVKVPYLCFAGAFLLMAAFFRLVRLPALTNPETPHGGFGALRHPHTMLGVLAIFMYVGGEVSVGSSIVSFLGTRRLGALPHEAASRFLGFYWGGLMIGRFMGALMLGELRGWARFGLMALVPAAAFIGLLAFADRSNALHYGGLLVGLLAAFGVSGASPQRMLVVFSGAILALLAAGILADGATARWAILGVGLFCSVMWSNIFTLAIAGLGPLKTQASSLLVMAILGGAVLPPLQGLAADRYGLAISYAVPFAAFAYVAFYGAYGYRAASALRAA